MQPASQTTSNTSSTAGGSQGAPSPAATNTNSVEDRLDALEARVLVLEPAGRSFLQSMDAGDWIAAVSALISLLAFFASIVVWRRAVRDADRAHRSADAANGYAEDANKHSQKSNDLAERAIQFSAAQLELGAREQINGIRDRQAQIQKEFTDLERGRAKSSIPAAERRELERIWDRLVATVEQEVTLFDVLCRQYLEGKTDSKSFRRDFGDEIRRLCEERKHPFPRCVGTPPTAPAKHLWRVYQEWYGPDL